MRHSSQIPQYAGALLITPSGEIITQHRDNTPGIQFPGSLSVFGGRVEEDEDVEKALIREVYEETLLDITPYAYTLYKIFPQRIAQNPNVAVDVDCYIFIITNIKPESLTVCEGQGYILLNKNSDLDKYLFSPTMLTIFEDYFENH